MNVVADQARLGDLLWLWLFPLVMALVVAAISIIEGSLTHSGYTLMRGFGRAPVAFLYQNVFAFGFASILGYGLSQPFSALTLVRLPLGLAAYTLANFVPEFGGLLQVGLIVGAALILTFVGAPLVLFVPAATVGAVYGIVLWVGLAITRRDFSTGGPSKSFRTMLMGTASGAIVFFVGMLLRNGTLGQVVPSNAIYHFVLAAATLIVSCGVCIFLGVWQFARGDAKPFDRRSLLICGGAALACVVGLAAGVHTCTDAGGWSTLSRSLKGDVEQLPSRR